MRRLLRKTGGDVEMKSFEASNDIMTGLSLDQRKPSSDIAKSWLDISGLEAKRRRLTPGIALAMGAVAMYALWHYGYLTPESVMLFLQSHPSLAPIVFLAIYAMSVMCLVPTLPLNLGAGLLWGPLGGGVITILGASAGAAGAFLAARYFSFSIDHSNAWFSNRIWDWMRAEVGLRGWRTVAFVRANPVFPFGLASYFFGLTSIRFRQYILTTVLSIAPLSIVFAAVGHSLGGIVLGGDAGILLEDIMIMSLVVTSLVFLRMAVRRMAKVSLV